MRDLERWKDKVELSLDGRQIFFLFFGTAVAACLLFVLGVLVGKRIEARALALTPLPALDQLGDATAEDDGLTFHKALTKPVKAAAPVAAKAESKPEVKTEAVAALPPPPKPEAARPPLAAPANASANAASTHFTLQ